MERAAILDTETTGLDRGTGTYAFLVGIGRFVGDQFRVRQLFMRDYDEEPALLEQILTELADIDVLVTFNGRAFDWPLLRTRAIMNRLELPRVDHLDLLHPARRFWSQVLDSCRLSRLEEDILGITREGDVPGHLIPYLFFDFLETGEPGQLLSVITHNRWDILSTTALAGYLGHAAADPLGAAPTGKQLPGYELYAMGRLLIEQGLVLEGIGSLHEACQRDLPGHLHALCLQLLAGTYRRLEDFDRATDIWKTMIEGGLGSIGPHIELAKYYEHRLKDFTVARQWTLAAMDVLERRRLVQRSVQNRLSDNMQDEMTMLVHRLERLERKLARK